MKKPFIILSAIAILALTYGSLTASAQRKTERLTDGWEFIKGPFDKLPKDVSKALADSVWQHVTIPHTWNADDMQTRVNDFYEGRAYYRRNIHITPADSAMRHFIRFEGVGGCADVYLNGLLVGSHKGAYSAFAVELTGALKTGDNELLVMADNASRPDVIPVNHQLFGVYGGIYRPVSHIVTPPACITVTDHASPGVYISQKDVTPESATVTVKTKIDARTSRPETATLITRIVDGDGRAVACDNHSLTLSPQGTRTSLCDFTITDPHLWNGIDDPYLYRVESILVGADGNVADSIAQPLGLRSYEVRPGEGFFLNGKKYPMYGVTRHQDWWGLGSALTEKEHDADLATIMDLGATTVRLAHYQQADYVYSRCDSLGLIVWAEIPFVNRVTGQEWDNAHSQLRELIRQSYNHPSIYVWGLHNEVYRPHDYTAALTASLHDLAKSEDPGRMTASVNGYGIADHPVNHRAEIQGMNRYFGWYEGEIPDIEEWVSGLERDYPWQALMLTEYGADGNPDHQTELLAESLDWSKPYYPETFQTKTHENHWGAISRHPYIIASYLWNTFDFACPMWSRGGVAARNLKGLVSFDRKLHKDSYYWYKANWSRKPVLHITQRRNVDRERKTTSVTVYSNRGVPAVTLNGRTLPEPHRGQTDVHWIFDDVTLDDGVNTIVATAAEGLTDTVVWKYDGDKDRSPAVYVNREQHSGF